MRLGIGMERKSVTRIKPAFHLIVADLIFHACAGLVRDSFTNDANERALRRLLDRPGELALAVSLTMPMNGHCDLLTSMIEDRSLMFH